MPCTCRLTDEAGARTAAHNGKFRIAMNQNMKEFLAVGLFLRHDRCELRVRTSRRKINVCNV